jgi:hypothetical protein
MKITDWPNMSNESNTDFAKYYMRQCFNLAEYMLPLILIVILIVTRMKVANFTDNV